MRVLINHFYCYCFGTFCKCLVIGKMFLSLCAISCFSCLFGVFGFGFWFLVFFLVGIFCLVWELAFLGGRVSSGWGFLEREAQLYSATGSSEGGFNTLRFISI